MESIPRRHHYVPAFHLAQFTIGGGRHDRLFVFDQGQVKSWPSTPDKSGHRRDFYAVDLGPDVNATAFESKVLGTLDGQFSRIVRDIMADQQLPEGEAFDTLLNFVAVSMARLPRTRQLVNHVTNHVVYGEVKSMISTEEGWRKFLAASQGDSNPLSEEEAQEFRQSILDEKFDVELDNTSHVQKIVEVVDEALPLLAERTWSIGFAASSTPDFVCSDAPVSLIPNEHFSQSDEVHLANRNTVLLMPLTRRAAVFGTFEQRPSTFQVNEHGVLSLNVYTILEAKHVFSATEDFAYLGDDGQPKGTADLVQSLSNRSGGYSNLENSLNRWLQNRPIS